MRSAVWHAVGDVRVAEVPDPTSQDPTDAIVEGTVLGHKAVGVVRELGTQVRNKNLSIKAGNCDHRRYIPRLLDLVRTGAVDLRSLIHQADQPLTGVVEAYAAFDRREPGWTKVGLDPSA